MAISAQNRRMAVIGVILFGVVSFVGVSEWRGAHAKEIIPWRDDLPAGLAEAKAGNRAVFAYFTAAWCGPCQGMKRGAWADEAVRARMVSRYVPVKIDVDAHPDLAQKFGVRAFPTFAVLSDDGTVLRTVEGAMDADEMRAWLEK